MYPELCLEELENVVVKSSDSYLQGVAIGGAVAIGLWALGTGAARLAISMT